MGRRDRYERFWIEEGFPMDAELARRVMLHADCLSDNAEEASKRSRAPTPRRSCLAFHATPGEGVV